MFWSRRFHLIGYLKASLWPVPVAGIIVGALLFFIADYSEQHFTDLKRYTFDASATTAIFAAVITATISFVGFVLTMLVLVIQFTGSSLPFASFTSGTVTSSSNSPSAHSRSA